MTSQEVDPCNCFECEDRCEFFRRLTIEEFDKLNSTKKAIRYDKGEVIVKGGTFNPHILLISSGFVKVCIESEDHKNFILEVLSPHNLITGNLFGHSVNLYTTYAITETLICDITPQPFIEIMEHNGRFTSDLLKYTNEHGDARFHRLHSITLKQSRGKLADVIIYLNQLSPDNEIFRFLSRQDIADMANISMENAIRTLKEFAEEGLIGIFKKEIQVLDLEGLHKVSMKG